MAHVSLIFLKIHLGHSFEIKSTCTVRIRNPFRSPKIEKLKHFAFYTWTLRVTGYQEPHFIFLFCDVYWRFIGRWSKAVTNIVLVTLVRVLSLIMIGKLHLVNAVYKDHSFLLKFSNRRYHKKKKWTNLFIAWHLITTAFLSVRLIIEHFHSSLPTAGTHRQLCLHI